MEIVGLRCKMCVTSLEAPHFGRLIWNCGRHLRARAARARGADCGSLTQPTNKRTNKDINIIRN